MTRLRLNRASEEPINGAFRWLVPGVGVQPWDGQSLGEQDHSRAKNTFERSIGGALKSKSCGSRCGPWCA